jgi:RNA polymerase sigma-70 factor (ECF subfamily)
MKSKNWESDIQEQIPRLRRYAHALTRNSHAADDLVQDCLERAWSKRDSWRLGSDLRAWLFTIMHNVFINSLRSNRLQTQPFFEDECTDRTDHLENSHVLRDFQSCLTKLKPDYQEVIVLACLEQMPYKEIAQITNIPVGTVMSRLSRGREQLRLLMEGHDVQNVVSIK